MVRDGNDLEEPMTAPLLDQLFRVIEHLDEDWGVPCQNRNHVGEAPAEWVMWSVKCCNRIRPCLLWCTPCRDRAVQRMATYDRTCPFCGHLFAPALAIIRLIEPLNRRTT
jgi:hypothetical protein